MIVLMIIIFGILSRLVIHTPNFTPVLSLALFGGMYLKGRQGLWVPLVLMALSDVLIGFHDTMVYTWGSILLISFLGIWIKSHKSMFTVVISSAAASLLFFVITNFGAFLSLYPHTLAGLQACFIAAIPFYASTAVSTIAYSVILFAGYEWLLRRSPQLAVAR